jgi:2,5-diketo-D-gluconate reductase A
MMRVPPSLTLNDDTTIPPLGFGVFRLPDQDAEAAVGAALAAGFRGKDTAAYYGNERGTGAAIAESGIPRSEVHLATKVWHTDLGYDRTLRAFDLSLDRLGVDYVDLYFIHWPVPSRGLYLDSWRALIEIQQQGRAKSIGVCNFDEPQLLRLHAETGIIPAVNQIELHPWLPQTRLREFHSQHNIHTQAWSPLAHGQLIDHPVLQDIAGRNQITTAQVLLNWNLSLGNAVLTKTANPERLRENLGSLDISLPTADRKLLATLDSDRRTGPDPQLYGR